MRLSGVFLVLAVFSFGAFCGRGVANADGLLLLVAALCWVALLLRLLERNHDV